MASAMDIARSHAAHCVVELFFRELKARSRVEDMPSSKRAWSRRPVMQSLQCQVTLVVSRALLARLRWPT